MQDIEQATDRLSNLMEDLLDVTRLQAGKLALHPSQTEIVALIRRVVAALQQTTARHYLIVDAAVKAREIVVDRERIEQILINLVDKAIKYSPEGGEIIICIWEDVEEGVGVSVQNRYSHVSAASGLRTFYAR